MSELERADYYREYDLFNCRKQKSLMPEVAHQKETIIKLNKWFNSDEFPSGAIIALPTGSGKTFTAVRFLCKKVLAEDYKVLWLAHTHHLLEQAYFSFGPLSEKINKGYEVGWIPEPRETLNVRVVSGTHEHFNVNQIKADDDVLIATIQSISNANKKKHPNLKEFLKSAKGKLFVVFDEAHHAPAPSYRNLIISLRKQFPEMYLLGLTATPTYMDINRIGWLKTLFPQEILHQTTVENLIAQGILARPIIKEPNTDFTPKFDERMYLKWVNSNKDLPQPIVTQLAKNMARNRKITEYYINNKDVYGKTIIFADRYDQCDIISKFLNKSGVSADVMYSNQGNERNAEILKKFRNNELEVLVNIKMLTEGTDVPDVDTVFITRQTTSIISMTQMVGRALRGPKFGGKPDANLVFFQDDWQKAINWVVWDSQTWVPTTPDKEYERGETESPRIPTFDFIIPHLYDTGDTEFTPFLTLMPLGWYKVNIAVSDEDGNPEEVDRLVMVFENERNSYENLIENLTEENLEEFDDENVKLIENKGRLKKWVEKFFPTPDKHIGGDILRSLCDIARHMAQNMKEPPIFIEFNERKSHDLDIIAQNFIEEGYGYEEVDQRLYSEYNKENRYWKVFYYNYELFKSQYNLSVEWILSQTRHVNIIIENKENEIIKQLETGHADERIEACEILGDMGLEELIHENTIEILKNTCKTDEDIKVKKAAENALNLINSLVLTYDEKEKIKNRDGHTCLCCGEDKKSVLQVDHIKPRYYEVDNSEDNLQTLCKICNILKSTETIDFRKTSTQILTIPSKFIGMEKIDSLELWEIRNSKNWKKFLSRYINFFYRCGAIKSIIIDENEQNWKIELNNGNDTSWFIMFKEDLKLNIRSKRNEYGYSGPKELSIYGNNPYNGKNLKECSELLKILKKGDDHQRAQAAGKLGNLKCEKAVGSLIKALEERNGFVPARAAASLGKIGDKRAINPLIRMFKGDHGDVAMRALVKIGKPSVKALIFNLDNNDMHTRKFSAEALGEIQDPSAIDHLLNSLDDNENAVKWRAIRALGNIGDKKVLKSIEILKNDPDMKVREECFKVLFFNNLDSKIRNIDQRITRKNIPDGFSYSSNEKVFLVIFPYYAKKIKFYAYVQNKSINRFEDNPEWHHFFLEKEEKYIQKTLDMVKTSFELITGETAVKIVTSKKNKKDKPGTYESPELKLLLKKYLSQNRKTANRMKKIVLPLCLEYDIVTREMIKEKLVLDGEASNIGNAGVILTSISGDIGRRDYLRQIINYERPYPWEKDNYTLVKKYGGIVQELMENFKD